MGRHEQRLPLAAARTPFGRFGGALADVRPDDLATPQANSTSSWTRSCRLTGWPSALDRKDAVTAGAPEKIAARGARVVLDHVGIEDDEHLTDAERAALVADLVPTGHTDRILLPVCATGVAKWHPANDLPYSHASTVPPPRRVRHRRADPVLLPRRASRSGLAAPRHRGQVPFDIAALCPNGTWAPTTRARARTPPSRPPTRSPTHPSRCRRRPAHLAACTGFVGGDKPQQVGLRTAADGCLHPAALRPRRRRLSRRARPVSRGDFIEFLLGVLPEGMMRLGHRLECVEDKDDTSVLPRRTRLPRRHLRGRPNGMVTPPIRFRRGALLNPR
ncbi:hypothetical protein ACF09J_31370 [Streptomyces sp. NPDC014889]|uniref:hypothetical protein n=1 Tax=Streptomyces sp. NPDC014889 TaxID=3364928 RepID=UPI0036F9F15A